MHERRRVGLGGGGELVDDGVEIGGGRAVADADGGEGLAVGLEVLPGGRGVAAEDELEADGARVPWLVGERGLLVLRVEGADGGERDRVQRQQHRVVVPQRVRWDRTDGEDRHLDHGGALDAHFRFHWSGREGLVTSCFVSPSNHCLYQNEILT